MRVLIVHHGSLPSTDGPVTGGALRAAQHQRALSAAGHEVHLLSRAQDGPGGFHSGAELHARARRMRPGAVICVQPEEAFALAGLDAAVVVDLYAPRLVEAPFEGRLQAELPPLLRAFGVGDVFLASNEAAADHWLGPLALAGLDLRQSPLLTVPLAAPQPTDGAIGAAAFGAPVARSATPLFVAGGAAWPWQDPRADLEEALAALDALGQGELWWFGGPPRPATGDENNATEAIDAAFTLPAHPRLKAMGWLPYPALLRAYQQAWAAFDFWAPNPERRLATGFRHADYLGCGLPVLSRPGTALAAQLSAAGAGLLTAGPGEALRQIIEDDALRASLSEGALRFARGPLSPVAAGAALSAWLAAPRRHPRGPSPLLEAAALSARAAAAEARAEAAAEAQARAEADAARSGQRLAEAQAQVHELLGVTGRLRWRALSARPWPCSAAKASRAAATWRMRFVRMVCCAPTTRRSPPRSWPWTSCAPAWRTTTAGCARRS